MAKLNLILKIRYHSKGFTLIEAIVAISILIVGFMAVLQFLPVGYKLASQSRHQSQALTLTSGKMEEYLNKTYSQLATGQVESRAPSVTDTGSQLYFFETEVVITYVDENLAEIVDDQGLKKLEVITYWDEHGVERSEKLVTLIADY